MELFSPILCNLIHLFIGKHRKYLWFRIFIYLLSDQPSLNFTSCFVSQLNLWYNKSLISLMLYLVISDFNPIATLPVL